MNAPSAERVVYVVVGWPKRMINDRVAKILRLRPQFSKLKVVVRGSGPSDDETLYIRAIPNPVGWLRRVGLHRLRYHLERLLYFPNAHVLYTWVARRVLGRAIAQDLAAGREVCVLTCVPNHENTSIGLYLKRRFPRIVWVVDWQDLWTYDDNYYLRTPGFHRSRLQRRERQVLDTADVNVTTNECAARILRDVFEVPPARVRPIHHHFDRSETEVAEADGSGRRAAPDPEVIRIGFLGSLFKPPRVPGFELMEAVRNIRASGKKVEIHLHGSLPPRARERKDWLEASGLVLEGPVPHRRSASALSRYDYVLVLLADLPNSRAVMSIKLPQYLLAGRPILALVPRPSAIADMVEKTRTGIVVPTNGDWRAGLDQVLRAPPPALTADQAQIDEFSWERISRRWLDVLAQPRPG